MLLEAKFFASFDAPNCPLSSLKTMHRNALSSASSRLNGSHVSLGSCETSLVSIHVWSPPKGQCLKKKVLETSIDNTSSETFEEDTLSREHCPRNENHAPFHVFFMRDSERSLFRMNVSSLACFPSKNLRGPTLRLSKAFIETQ